jgi:hypothetical protein
MKLIIREYLSLLKESKEIDRMLPDLLLAMGIEPIIKAQIGVRQYGVDVAAVGPDEDGVKKLFLFIIKQGNIGRSDWDSNNQSVRQSLDEIKDVYLGKHIRPEHTKLTKNIILCTGGDLKQELELNWNGYVSGNSVADKIEYAFWGGDKLAILIEKYIFNDQLLPVDLRANIRKTLALIADPDYDLNDYYSLLEKLLFHTGFDTKKTTSSKNKIKKTFRLIHLCLNIIFFWSKQEGNLKPALLAAERTILFLWDFLRRNKLINDKTFIGIFYEIFSTTINIYSEYFNKIQKHCYVQNGLSFYGRQFIQESLIIFEQIGIISLLGLIIIFDGHMRNDENSFKKSEIIKDAVKAIISNHMVARSPSFDSHAIDISIAIYLLANWGENKFISDWIRETIDHIAFSYRNLKRYFPIQSDSFDDLVALNISGSLKKETLMEMSTLIPILAQWSIVLGLEKDYQYIRESVSKIFPNCTLQIWYPDDDTEKYIYSENAALKSGAVEAPIELTDTVEEMKQKIKLVQKNTISPNSFSSIKKGFTVLPLISSRHFRTPFPPFYWQLIITKNKNSVEKEKES